MVALNHAAEVPSWDERERAELMRRARLAAARDRDGHLPAHVVLHDQRWPLRPVPYPYRTPVG